MSSLVSDEAKLAITRSIGAIERKTCAEIVAALRPASGDYRRADLTFGTICAFALLCFFLYSPEPFDFTFFPLELAACFVLGAVTCAYLAPLRRILVPRSVRVESVARAARSMFLESGVDRTSERTGILLYLSTFERDVFLVFDRGIDSKALAREIATAERDLGAAMKRGSLEAFLPALEALGEALAKHHPVKDGDVDELSNEVAA
jgi:putative membrane protein